MIGESARFYARGGWGLVRRAMAYDLTKGALVKNAKITGLQRYGKEPGNADDDTRPLAQAFDIEWMSGIIGNEFSPQVDGASLTRLGNVFDGLEGFSQGSSVANNSVSFRSAFNIEKNGGWCIRAFLHPWPKDQILKLHQWIWGSPGAGFLFQIRGESAEVAGLSEQYNESDMGDLRLLWGLAEPTDEDLESINTLQEKLFVDFESLSFERATGRGKWVGEEWTLAFIAEPRGVLHIVAIGMDATAHEVSAILKTREAGVLWEDTPLRLWAAGGVFFFSLGEPLFRAKSNLFYGPFKNGYFTENLDDIIYAYNVYTDTGHSVVMSKVDIDAVRFGFDVTITNTNRRRTPWIYGLAARIEPGDRNGDMDIGLDTDVPYIPANPASPRDEGEKILDVELSWDGGMKRRKADIAIRDIHGLTSTATPLPKERVGTLLLGNQPIITDGLVLPFEQTDMGSLADDLTLHTSRFETDLKFTLADGWQILDETECEPPPIGDNMPLGTYFKVLLAIAGFKGSKVAGIPDAGKRVSRAALGEDWAERPDGQTSVGDAVRALFNSYGLGWCPFHGNDGVWNMVQPSSTPVANFSSSRLPSPLTALGRSVILTPIDISHDSSNFFNHFIVYGGESKKKRLVAEWTDYPSINNPNSPTFIGRVKTKRLINTGLRTQSDVNYAMRSLRYQNGRGGRRVQCETFWNPRLSPADRITADGKLWELEGISGASWAADTMQINLLEVNY